MENNNNNEEEKEDSRNLLMPIVRVYVSMASSDHDLVPVEDVIDAIEDPADFLRQMIDRGIVNIWASDFVNSIKMV